MVACSKVSKKGFGKGNRQWAVGSGGKGKGQRAEKAKGKRQKAEGRGQRAEGRDEKAKGRGQRKKAKGKGQKAKVKAKEKRQSAFARALVFKWVNSQ
jgi:hypothetical protein